MARHALWHEILTVFGSHGAPSPLIDMDAISGSTGASQAIEAVDTNSMANAASSAVVSRTRS